MRLRVFHREPWLLRWGTAVLVLALLAGLIWVRGGFGEAAGNEGPVVAAGTAIPLERWDVVIERAEFVNTSLESDYVDRPRIRVYLQLTSTAEASAYGLASGQLRLMVSGATAAPGEPSFEYPRSRSGGFDPDVPRSVAVDFEWPDSGVTPTPPAPRPEQVRVILRDEHQAENFVWDDQWAADWQPAAIVVLDCPDKRLPG